MANNMYLHLGLDDSELRRRLKVDSQELMTVAGQKAFVKLQLDDSDFRKSYQKTVDEAMKSISRLKYVKGGKDQSITGINSAQEAIRYYEREAAKSKYTAKQQQAFLANASKARNYIQAIIDLGNAIHTTAEQQRRLNAAVVSGNVAAATRQATARRASAHEREIDAVKRLRKEINGLYRERANMRKNTSLTNTEKLKEELRYTNLLQAKYRQLANTYSDPKRRAMAINRVSALREEATQLSSLNNQYLGQSSILSGLGSLLARYFNIYTVINFGKKVAEMTGFFERQLTALEGIVGSAAKAQELMQQIKSFALKSPFEAKDLIQFTKQLSAYQIPTDQLFNTTKMLADLSAGLGVSMDRLVLAYGQVRSASVLRGQELRQFTEAGIPLVDALAKKFTELKGEVVSTADVFKLISERAVSFEMVSSVLRDMTSEGGRFHNMQDELSKTTYGQKQKITDIWNQALDKIGKSSNGLIMGIITKIQDTIKNLVPIVKGLGIGALIALLTKGLTKAISSASAWVVSLGGVRAQFTKQTIELTRINTELLRVEQTIRRTKNTQILQTLELKKQSLQIEKNNLRLQKMTMIANAISMAISILSIVIGAVATAIMSARREAEEFKNEIKDISSGFDNETEKLTTGLDDIVNKLRTAKEGTKEYEEAISSLKSNYSDYINITDSVIEALKNEKNEVDANTGAYTGLQGAIIGAIEARKQFEKYQTIANKYADTYSDTLAERMVYYFKEGSSFYRLSSQVSEHKTGDIVKDVFSITLNEMMRNFESSSMDFVKRFKLNLSQNLPGINDNILQKRLGAIISAFDQMTWLSPEWNKYLEELDVYNKLSSNNVYNKIKSAFEIDGIIKPTGDNDIERDINKQKSVLEVIKKLLSKGGELKSIGNNTIIEALNKEIAEFDYHSIHNIINEIDTLKKSLKKGSEEYDYLTYLETIFKKLTTDLDLASATVANNIRDNFEIANKDASDYNSYAATIFNNLSAETYYSKRKEVQEQKADAESELETYKGAYAKVDKKITSEILEAMITSNEIEPKDIDRLRSLVKKRDTMEILMGREYFAIGDKKEEKSKQQTSVPVPPELTLAIEEIKKAWETYKTASQSQGGELGIAYMRNNEEFKKFFNGFSEQLFKGITVGTNGKQLNKILEGVWETSGFEEGAIKFEDALRAISTALKEYAGNSKHLKQFANLAKEIDKYIINAVAKYNVQGWIQTMNRSLADMRREFEQTTKAINLARDAQKKGVIEILNKNPFMEGITLDGGKTDSQILQGQIGDLIATYLDNLRKTMQGDDKEKVVQGASAILEGNDFTTYKGIQDFLNRLNSPSESGVGQFVYEEFGETGKYLVDMLTKLLAAYDKEITDFSGEIFTGDELRDIIANAIRTVSGDKSEMDRHNKGLMGVDAGRIKQNQNLQEQFVNSIFESFLKRTDFTALAKSGIKFGIHGIDVEPLKAQLEEEAKKLEEKGLGAAAIELRNKFKDLESSVDKFNASIGSAKSFGKAFDQIFNAKELAKAEYDANKTELDKQEKLMKPFLGTDANGNEILIDPAQVEEYEKLIALRKINIELGENGEKRATEIAKQGWENLTAAYQVSHEAFEKMVGAIRSVISSLSSVVKTANKFYDIMNDGENPDWMKETEGYLDNFGQAFEDVITHIFGVISAIVALIVIIKVLNTLLETNVMGWVMLGIGAFAGAIAAIVAAFQQYDAKLENRIEKLSTRLEELDNLITNLNAEAERQVGFERLATQLDAIGQSATKASMYLKQAELEDAKKNTDTDKYKEYMQNYRESLNDFENSLKDVVDGITGSIDDWASSMSNAIRGAFQNGENAARAFRSTIKEMMGDIVENMLRMAILEPLIQDAMEEFTHSEALKKKYTKKVRDKETGELVDEFDQDSYLQELLKNISDPKAAAQLEKKLNDAGTAMINGVNSLPESLKEAFSFNSNTASLSGGIQEITEDTARRLEALQNSQLGETIMIRNLLVQYLPLVDNSTYYATIQSAIVQMNSNISTMLAVLNAMHSGFNELRNTSARPLHVTMV